MQVPQALGGTGAYVPADATLMWPAIQQILGAQGTDISMIPAPNSTIVSTQLAVLNPTTASFEAVAPEYVADLGEMEATINNTFEVGYKGVLGDRFVAQADVWHSRIKDFVGPLRVETPTVFYDATTLAQYLSNPAFGLSAAQVQGLTSAIAQIPVGTVTPDNAEDPADPFLTYRNFGDVDLTGLDLSMSWFLDQFWTVSVNYSFVNKDFFEDAAGVSDIALNAPKHKGGLHLGYRNRPEGFRAGTRVRFVDSFPVLSGVYVGDVDAFAVVDFNASWEFAKNPGTTVSINVLNALDNKHKEFVGVPELGRVATLRLTQRI
jgi:iron complex outermembrane receptor protein